MKNAMIITISGMLFCLNAQAYDEKKRKDEKNEKEQMEVALKAMTFPISRMAIGGISSVPNGGRLSMDIRPFCALLLPTALIADTGAFFLGAAATPVLAGRDLVKKVIYAIDIYINDHSPDELTKITFEGYKKRLAKVVKLSEGQDISGENLMVLSLAGTALDSVKCAPEKLILGNGKELSGNVLFEHSSELPAEAKELYDNIARAAMAMKEYKIDSLSYAKLVKEIMQHFASDKKASEFSETESGYGLYKTVGFLRNASLNAQKLSSIVKN
jgi:hypothetical protein